MPIIQLQGFQFGLLSVFSLFGIVQGVLMSGLLIFSKKYDIPTRKYMVMLILVCTSISALEIIYRYRLIGPSTPFWVLPISFFPLIIPAVYFILKYYLTLELKVKPWEYSLYIPFCFAFFHEVNTSMKYMSGNLSTKEIQLYSDIDDYIVLNMEFINGVICLFIFSYFFVQIKKYKQEILTNFPKLTPKSLVFLSISLIAGVVLALASTLISFADFLYFNNGATTTAPHDRRVIEFGITALISWFTYGMALHPELLMDTKQYLNETNEQNQEQNQEQKVEITQPANNLSDNTEIYHEKLLNFMQEKAPYRDPDFSLESLAQEMNLSKSYLSKIINTREGKNFFEFVNHYRVEEVKQKLKDESFDHFSIIAIALEAGFKSKSTFNTAFKKMTGLPPSKFKKKRKSKTY